MCCILEVANFSFLDGNERNITLYVRQVERERERKSRGVEKEKNNELGKVDYTRNWKCSL